VQGDDATGLFFMRVHFEAPPQLATLPRWTAVRAMYASSSAWTGASMRWRAPAPAA
jgi:hypothetical protein